jgi:serine/threonine protein kinase
MKQILNGYKYLVAKNVIHRDLKPANVMRFGSQWKIGDFGFSRYCKEDYILEKIYMGTPTYMPP